jgi:hypothetical protein
MMPLFQSVEQIDGNQAVIARRRYGLIEVVCGELVAVHFRPWPKIVSTAEAEWLGGWRHARHRNDQCLLYYNQPFRHSNFLALKYTVSTWGTSYRTFRRALAVLDEVARIKRTDAIVAEVTNTRISDRFLRRQGWERHLLNSPRRHYIKRFYGKYANLLPTSDAPIAVLPTSF